MDPEMMAKLDQIKQMATDLVSAVDAISGGGEAAQAPTEAAPGEGEAAPEGEPAPAPETPEEIAAPAAPGGGESPLKDYLKGQAMKKRMV
jgi:hypothetical protein